MDEDEKPLTFEQLLRVFVFWANNEESVAKSFLPDSTTVKIDRDCAIAASQFIDSVVTECNKYEQALQERKNGDTAAHHFAQSVKSLIHDTEVSKASPTHKF